MAPTINFTDPHGRQAIFSAHPPRSLWPRRGGVYMFVRQPASGLNQWQVLYAGMAENLAERLNGHERWDEAARRGATHVAILVVDNAFQRAELEQQLIKFADPPLNVQLRRGNGPTGFTF